MSLIVKVGKAGKRVVKKFLPEEKHHVSYTRRIERVKTRERVVAMTFDDGPMDLPSSPDKFDGKALTDILLDTLGEYGAQGTFDVVGDTSENYPDTAGKSGQADWGGVRYDHYPDINQDERGGAVHNQRLLRRMRGAPGDQPRVPPRPVWEKALCLRQTGPFPRLGPGGVRPDPSAHPAEGDLRL